MQQQMRTWSQLTPEQRKVAREQYKSLKALPPGSFYTEPSDRSHFAETRDSDVVVQITGVGPSSTRYIDPASDPQRGQAKP